MISVRVVLGFLVLAFLIANVQCSQEATVKEAKKESVDDEAVILRATSKCTYGTVPYETNRSVACDACGNSNFTPNPRIVGGNEAVPYSWPAQVFIVQNIDVNVRINGRLYNVKQAFICGGTIVNRYTVLTAAHCITEEFDYEINNIEYTITLKNAFEPTMYDVYVGAYDLTFLRTGGRPTYPTVKMSVGKVTRHSNYNTKNFMNDIALYMMKTPIDFNQYVQPACMPDPKLGSYPPVNSQAFASGWGTLKEKGQTPNKLQNVRLTTYDSSSCANVNPSYPKNWNSQMCAGDITGQKDTCQGDSGGGLYVYDTNQRKYVVVGITSYGEGCARYGKPGIYTRVSNYYDWIQSNWATKPSNAYAIKWSHLTILSTVFVVISSIL